VSTCIPPAQTVNKEYRANSKILENTTSWDVYLKIVDIRDLKWILRIRKITTQGREKFKRRDTVKYCRDKK
jgi:hypothetical protein